MGVAHSSLIMIRSYVQFFWWGFFGGFLGGGGGWFGGWVFFCFGGFGGLLSFPLSHARSCLSCIGPLSPEDPGTPLTGSFFYSDFRSSR